MNFPLISILYKAILQQQIPLTTSTVQTSITKEHVSNPPDGLDFAIKIISPQSPEFISNSASHGQTSLYIDPERSMKVETYFNQDGRERALSINLFPTDKVIQVVSNDTAWHVLRANGEVWSWGDDARFPGVLGREVTEER
jgi:hypothetical protein